MDKRHILFLAMLGVFVAWLGIIFGWLLPMALKTPENIEPMLLLVTGLGVGGVTQFFILLLKDGWQFYFRKRETAVKV